MVRIKFQTLTEQMFYTLLCLKDECYGMDILDRVAYVNDVFEAANHFKCFDFVLDTVK